MYGSINKEKFSDRTYEWGMAGKRVLLLFRIKFCMISLLMEYPIPTKGRSKVVTLDSIVEFIQRWQTRVLLLLIQL